MVRTRRPLADRLFEKVDASGPCWLWSGASNRGGYGAVHVGDGRTGIVHRIVWEMLVGPIPNGMELDHLCRVRSCCNPDHLEPVTRQANVSRGAQRAGVPRRTTCINGHPFTPETTKPNHGARGCRICSNEANRRYRERRSAA